MNTNNRKLVLTIFVEGRPHHEMSEIEVTKKISYFDKKTKQQVQKEKKVKKKIRVLVPTECRQRTVIQDLDLFISNAPHNSNPRQWDKKSEEEKITIHCLAYASDLGARRFEYQILED